MIRAVSQALPAILDRTFRGDHRSLTTVVQIVGLVALTAAAVYAALPLVRGFQIALSYVGIGAVVIVFLAWNTVRVVFREPVNPVLLRGDRRAAAEAMWPARQYPTVYQDIPADIRRPLAWDGRLLGGREVTWLGWRHLTDEIVTTTAAASGRAAFRLAMLVFAALSLYAGYRLASGVGMAGRTYPSWAEHVGDTWPIVAFYVLSITDFIFGAASVFLLAAAAAGFLFVSAWSFGFWRTLNRWWQGASAALATPTRDALLLYKTKADIRRAEYESYCRQVKDATGRLASLPLLPVGSGLGLLRARGDMESPSRGQLVAFDGESIRQHVLVLGGTGVGKTRLVMRPLFERVMTAPWGASHKMGAYVTDGKGTLWRDVAGVVGGRNDVVIVGTGADQFGVDLLAGMSPLEISTVFKSVSGQVAGKPSDDFWPELASLTLMHSAALARVLHDDEETVAAWGDVRPYSLLGLAKIATNDTVQDASITRVLDMLDAARADGGEASVELLEAEESIRWLVGTWKPMAIETRSGIVGNINLVLGKLGGAGHLAKRFFAGSRDRVVDVDHALNGGILMIAVGENEFGAAGKIVNCWLKSRLFIHARRRLVSDPEACRTHSCALFADEFQMLVTAGPDSDTNFWNIARETGLFLVAATQSIAALQQVLGTDATANLVNLLRSKIVLKTEEISTLEFVRKIAGELPRGFEAERDFYSTQGVREIERPDVATPAVMPGLFSGFLPALPSLWTHGMRAPVLPDLRFIWKGGQDKGISAEGAAYQRADDKSQQAIAANFSYRPKVEIDELLMGNGYAFAIIQRAGGDRADMIDLQAA